MKKNNSLKTLTSHKSDEHNTPSYIIEASREVLGVIDLDPMSNALANETVKATIFYTKEDNGLDKDWYGRVWLNPPFSLAKSAIIKLIDSYKSGQVEEAVLLIKSDVSTQKYKWLYPYPFCELNKRVKFESSELTSFEIFLIAFSVLRDLGFYKLLKFVLLKVKIRFNDSAPFPVVLFYLGRKYYKWNKVMSKIGKVHPGSFLFTNVAMMCSSDDLRNLGVIE